MYTIKSSNGNSWSKGTTGFGLYYGSKPVKFETRKAAELVVSRIKHREAYKDLTITIEEEEK